MTSNTTEDHPEFNRFIPDPDCMAREIMSRIATKWSLVLIAILIPGPLRFNDLKRHIPGISHRMLVRALRGLEEDGLVTRTVDTSELLKVDYALSDLGQTIVEPMTGLRKWAQGAEESILKAREEFKKRTKPKIASEKSD